MTRAREETIPAWVDGILQPVEKLETHRRGLRHKAISVFVNRGGETLLQKRAAGKYHTPGLWSNACCTHPRWGEDAADCARRRLGEELGIAPGRLERRGHVVYRADVGNDLTEHEEVDVFAAELPHRAALSPDPAEVAATRWIAYADLEAALATGPEAFTPWLKIYMTRYRSIICAAE